MQYRKRSHIRSKSHNSEFGGHNEIFKILFFWVGGLSPPLVMKWLHTPKCLALSPGWIDTKNRCCSLITSEVIASFRVQPIYVLRKFLYLFVGGLAPPQVMKWSHRPKSRALIPGCIDTKIFAVAWLQAKLLHLFGFSLYSFKENFSIFCLGGSPPLKSWNGHIDQRVGLCFPVVLIPKSLL